MNKLAAHLKQHAIEYIFSILFFTVCLIGVYNDFYYLYFLPIFIVLGIIAIVRYDIVMLATVVLTPLSVVLRDFYSGASLDIALPTEPFLILITMLLLVQLLFGKSPIDKRFWYAPTANATGLYLLWILISASFSTMPIVSFKFLVAKLWFILPYFVLLTRIFKEPKRIKQFVWLYILPLLFVIGWTITRHIIVGINDKNAAHWVVVPFYNDHTEYGAALAFSMFLLLGFILAIKEKRLLRNLSIGVLFILLVATVFSYSRAAWLSVLVALGSMLLIKLKVKFKYVLGGVFVVAIAVIFSWASIIENLERNNQDSSQMLGEHIQSITNISTDASNTERINRWDCAISMFKDKPVFGFGPGTYMFQYPPYQRAVMKTWISTSDSDLGNAHSEYLGPLSEQGLPGVIFYVILLIVALKAGIVNYHKIEDPQLKSILLGAILGLVTYAFHGFLNNFLDSDKMSALFWGSIAIITAMDIYHVKGNESAVVVQQDKD